MKQLAYVRAVSGFLIVCEHAGLESIIDVEPPSPRRKDGRTDAGAVSPHSQVAPRGGPLAVRLVRHAADRADQSGSIGARAPAYREAGETPVLDPAEARQLLDSIDVSTQTGLHERALIGAMVYSSPRIGAVTGMKIEDVYVQNHRFWMCLHEKGGKRHEMPCHHNLEAYLHAYIDGCGLGDDPEGPLFRTIDRTTKSLSRRPLPQANAYAMILRRAIAAGIAKQIGNNSFRVAGITAYLKNGGTLERAAAMANHSSTRTTQLYGRRPDEVTLDEVEWVLI